MTPTAKALEARRIAVNIAKLPEQCALNLTSQVPMSAFGGKADIDRMRRDVCF
jgi:hypothetical protein